ncbi:hypothetical protein J3459_013067 [Metarhizium acridum]|nr:hypothetical protein J3459_013067 [Metarhizium acridum]
MIGEKGMIDSLRCEENWRIKRPLREGEGVVDGSDLGGGCSGTILEVGPGVTRFAPGDRIFTIASYCFSNKLIAS